MFYNCSAFTGDLSHWDVSKVTRMHVRLRALRLDRPARPRTPPSPPQALAAAHPPPRDRTYRNTAPLPTRPPADPLSPPCRRKCSTAARSSTAT
eukprot:2340593-Prymnesium_polylepis.1